MYHINNYPMYGLNRYRSFLHAPMHENEPLYMELTTDDDVTNFCIDVLSRYECPDSAIFAVFNDGRQKIYVKNSPDNDEAAYISELEGDNDIHFFSEFDGQFRLCCYNLIIEHEPGMWMIES